MFSRIGRRVTYANAAFAAVVLLGLSVPTSSPAAFTRQSLRQIKGTPTSSFHFEGEAQDGSGGIAVDEHDNVWVGEGFYPKVSLDEFGAAYQFPGNEFLQSLDIEAFTTPDSMAIERESGHLYLTGDQAFNPEYRGNMYGGSVKVEVFDREGKLIRRWPLEFGGPAYVAVDNSSEPAKDPSACTAGGCFVYVSHTQQDPRSPIGDDLPIGIEKFDSEGSPVPFSSGGGSLPYVSGNEITGAPADEEGCSNNTFKSVYNQPSAVTVDSFGDIYVASSQCRNETPAVLEYRPSGEFVRAITGEETPGIEGNHERDGFGGGSGNFGSPGYGGLAFDPVSDHLLVSVAHVGNGAGVIDEFEAGTGPNAGRYVNQITESAGTTPLRGPVALSVDSHGDLYALDRNEKAVNVYGPGHFLPSLTIVAAGEKQPSSAVLSGSVNPEGFKLSACSFQYVSEEAFEQNVQAHGGVEAEGFADLSSGGEAACLPAAASLQADHSVQSVHAEITGLASGTTYRYRLVATSEGALGGTAASRIPAFTAPHAPRVEATSADNLSSTFVDLHARIDPLGAETAYRFEYDTSAYTSAQPHGVSVPVPNGSIGTGGPSGSAVESVLAHVGGLSPATTYHFRVVASNAFGEVDGPEQDFTTLPQAAPGLPDNRAYELVTPPVKDGGSDMFGSEQTNGEYFNKDDGYASESGDGFLLETLSAFGPFPASLSNAYVFTRTSAGWSYRSLASPSLGVQSIQETVFDPDDLSQVGISVGVGSSASEHGSQRETLVGASGGPYTLLHSDAALRSGEKTEETTSVVDASHSLSNVLLESTNRELCPGAQAQKHGTVICEWDGGEEEARPQLKLVNVDDEGELLSKCGARLGAGGEEGAAHGAVSADGSKVFFTAPDPQAKGLGGACWNGATVNAPQLYMRSGGETVELSAPEAGVSDPSGQHPAAFVGASEDGSKVFFVTETELTGEAEELGLHDRELYEYDTEDAKLTRVSAGEAGSPSAKSGAGVLTVPAVAAEGDAVYFTATGRLTAGAPAAGANEVDLYRYDTSDGSTSYVATIYTYDYGDDYGSCGASVLGEISLCAHAQWYTTPNGRYLLFGSERDLTGYSTVGCGGQLLRKGQQENHGYCNELYRYDAATGGLTCVSCNPSGAPPTSHADFTRSGLTAPASGPVRAMSDNGAYVFFDTADALVPADTNGTLDVYEWHEGQISLISSGTDSAASFFLAASPDGANVFFGTHAKLVAQDTDLSGDVYDARICTEAEPCIKPPAGETAQCEGDACQNPPPAPLDATPSSLTFAGAGNLTSEAPAQVKTRAKVTTTQKLANALKACRKQPERKRGKCDAQARKRYTKQAGKRSPARRASTSGRAGK